MNTIRINEAELVRAVSPNDQMGAGNAGHYFGVGRSALECIRVSLGAAGIATADVNRILDLPCGHGRVLRYLRAAFPAAEITACDLLRDGVDFCAATFGAIPVYSEDDPARIPVEREAFDLIWVGSLFTHFDAGLWSKFLGAFRSFLRPGGLVVFTTHGRKACRLMLGGNSYGLPDARRSALLTDYFRTGFGYAKYADSDSYYGLSLSDAGWVFARIAELDDFRVVHFAERAWDNHHDCFACVRDDVGR